MGRLPYLAALMMATVAVAAAPAPADVTGNPPDYVLEEDGTLVFGGDLATDCPSFVGGFETGFFFGGVNPEQAQSVLELCRQEGFLPSDGSAPPSSPDPATADATADTADDDESAAATGEAGDEESATASASAEAEALPDTGGVSPAPLTILPALLLVGAGIVVVRVVRRN